MRTLQSTHAARKHVLRRDDAQPGESKPGILLVVAEEPPDGEVVDRALWITRGLRGSLRTVVALPHRGAVPPAPPEETAAMAEDIVCSRTSLREAALVATRQHPAALIVVGPESGGDGAGAVTLCDALRIPVLVARTPRPGGTIIAATDLDHFGYPVLTAAWALARCVGRPTTFLHVATSHAPEPWSERDVIVVPPVEAAPPLEAAKLARLRWLAAGDGNVSIMLARAASPLSAIVAIARDRAADLVAVGLRCRSRVSRWFHRGIAQEAVDRCGCSVLIVPVVL